jgi:hypothetical protein
VWKIIHVVVSGKRRIIITGRVDAANSSEKLRHEF